MSESLRNVSREGWGTLGCLARGEFEEGLRSYKALTAPSAEEEGWAGQCLVMMQRRTEGLELLLRARHKGWEDAGGLAAAVHRFNGDPDRARVLLSDLEPEHLSPFGHAVAERERGMLLHLCGEVGKALTHVQRAWEIAVTDETARLFMGSFASALAFVLSELGRNEQALSIVNLALPTAGHAQRVPLLWTRALCCLNTGQFGAAMEDLNGLSEDHASPDALPLLRYYRGVAAYSSGMPFEAAALLRQAAASARAAGQPETEFYARLWLSQVALAEDDVDTARAELARAGALACGRRAQAFLALHQGALLVRVRGARPEARLHLALREFRALGMEREVGRTHAHLAEMHLRHGRVTKACEHLTSVADVRHALGSGVVLAREFLALPETLALLQDGRRRAFPYLEVLWQDVHQLPGAQPAQLTLTTLGSYGLLLDGQLVKLNVGLKRTVELLTYLHEYGESSLESLQTTVFEDHDPATARDYLHVARNALRKAVPQLLVPFDHTRRVYHLQPQGARLHWDVQYVRQAVRRGGEPGLREALARYTGPFLPQTTTAWAREVRGELEASLLRLGLTTLETLLSRGCHKRCVQLARDLLRIDALDIGINALLVRAVWQGCGAAAAQQEVERITQVFRREVGEVPEPLLTLRDQLNPSADH